MTEEDKKARIRQLNDEVRLNGVALNARILTAGRLAQEDPVLGIVVGHYASKFTEFNEDNDPHGEHDCAKFTVKGQEFLFKFDYFALDEEHLSEHPEDPAVTIRVMTLMYAEDY
ncbi:DUF3768 domain-containing protein [Agrobacterium sp. CG674]